MRVRGDKKNTNMADDGNGDCFEETTNEFLSHDHTCQIALYKTHVSVAHFKTNSDRNKQRTNMHDTEHESVRVFQLVCPCLSKVSHKTSVHCTRVIAMGLRHSPVGSRTKEINNFSDQYNPETLAARLPPRQAPTCAYVFTLLSLPRGL